jgi:hypothetical protein
MCFAAQVQYPAAVRAPSRKAQKSSVKRITLSDFFNAICTFVLSSFDLDQKVLFAFSFGRERGSRQT